uniref:Gag protein n=1 Tax=Phlebotomus papatasi TaxID=29031 RepID=A0A1B0DA29_PHLPP
MNAESDEEQIEYLDEDFWVYEEPDISSIKEMKNLSMAVTQQSQNVAKLAIRYAGLKELPKFSGNIDEWANFYAQYVKTTSDGQFTSSENVTRLEKCLSGEARELVASLLTVSGEAESIIEILKERFGHPRQQLQRLMQRAKQAEAPNDNKPISVVKFAAEVRNVAIILQALNEGRHIQDSTILNEFERKLTPIMKNMWAEVIHANPDYTMIDLMKFVNMRAKLALAITPLDGEGPSTSRQKSDEEKRPKFRGKGVFTVTSAGRGKCAVCQDNHYTSECPEFKKMSPEQRFAKTSELNLCRSCLGRNHRMYRCFKRRECGVEGCRLSHHNLLHYKAEEKTETKKEAAAGKN